MNSYSLGGYLLFRLHPESKVFIDPRTDLYGNEFFERYLILLRADEGWREIFSEWEIDYAVLLASAPLRAALVREEGFVEVYQDGKYAVLVRPLPRFEALIEASRESDGRE
ncbi:MAG: hypothetical protein AAF495_18065 [Pseudomonadota bacterium]